MTADEFAARLILMDWTLLGGGIYVSPDKDSDLRLILDHESAIVYRYRQYSSVSYNVDTKREFHDFSKAMRYIIDDGNNECG